MTHRNESASLDNFPASPERRQVIAVAAVVAASPMLGGFPQSASAQSASPPTVRRSIHSKRRKLGPLDVSALGLGCLDACTGFYSPPKERSEMVRLLRSAYDQGVDFFDTAEIYGPYISEEVVGQALAPMRDKVTIATKFGFSLTPDSQAHGRTDSRPQHIRAVVDASLKRLRTDRIDLLYQHRVDPKVPIEDVAGTIKDLVAADKVRHYGLSEAGLNTVRRAHAVHPLAAVQYEYSLLWRGPEDGLLDLCGELGIGMVPWSPLGMGLVAGKFNADSRLWERDFRNSDPRFAPDALRANMALADLVTQWAREKEATPAQLALAWLLYQRPWIVPIPGTVNPEHLNENLGALDIAFSPTELDAFTAAVSAIPVTGARMSPGLMDIAGLEAPLPEAARWAAPGARE